MFLVKGVTKGPDCEATLYGFTKKYKWVIEEGGIVSIFSDP